MRETKKITASRVKKFDRRVVLSTFAAAILIVAGLSAAMGGLMNQSVAQNPSLTELANSLEQVHPTVTVTGEKVVEAEGKALDQIGITTTSFTIELGDSGRRQPVSEDGQAELTLNHVKLDSGESSLVGTVTNTGTESFYLLGLTINGGTKNGPAPLGVDAVFAGWTKDVQPDRPQPPITEPLIVNPGESVSASIAGTWNIPNTSTLIDTFEVGAVYAYEIQGVTTDEPVYNWSIGLSGITIQ